MLAARSFAGLCCVCRLWRRFSSKEGVRSVCTCQYVQTEEGVTAVRPRRQRRQQPNLGGEYARGFLNSYVQNIDDGCKEADTKYAPWTAETQER